MSRTYRKSRNSFKPEELLYVESLYGGEYLEWVPLKKGTPEYAEAAARHRADGRRHFLHSAPHWFCNCYERSYRQRAKKELRDFLADTEHEVQIQVNHRRSASYNWW